MFAHASGQAFLAVGRHGVGGHGHDRQCLEAQFRADLARRRVAVHHRHLDVHQHDVELRRRRHHRVQRLLAVGDHGYLRALGSEQFFRHLLVDEVVLGHQNPQACQAAPWPGVACGLAQTAVRGFGIEGRLLQHGRGHGLDQIAIEQGLLLRRALCQGLAALGRDHHDHQPLLAVLCTQLAQLLRRFPTVHGQHDPVQEYHVIGEAARLQPGLHHFKGLLTAQGQIGGPAPGAAHFGGQLTGDRVVVDHQDPALLGTQGRVLEVPTIGHGLTQRKAEGKAKGAAYAQLALQADVPPHQTHQTLADGQAKAGAAKAPRGRGLGLGEAGKDRLLVLRGNADATVLHQKIDLDGIRVAFQLVQADDDFAALGELDRVAGQVDQHLLQALQVPDHHVWNGPVYFKQHLDVLGAGIGRQDAGEVAHHAVQPERLRIQRHLAGLDLGQVENVVDQTQQRMRRTVGLVGIVVLLRRQAGFLQQRQHAQNGVHRRADFMAHIGQKLRFRPVGVLGHGDRPLVGAHVQPDGHRGEHQQGARQRRQQEQRQAFAVDARQLGHGARQVNGEMLICGGS